MKNRMGKIVRTAAHLFWQGLRVQLVIYPGKICCYIKKLPHRQYGIGIAGFIKRQGEALSGLTQIKPGLYGTASYLCCLICLNQDSVKKSVTDLIAIFCKAGCKYFCQPMGTGSDVIQTIRPMPDSIHGRHDRQQGLCGTDIGGRFFAANMLFTCLQGKPIGRLALTIDGYADNPARQHSFIGICGCHKSSVRPAISHRHPKTLGRAYRHIRAQFTRRHEQGKAQQITGHDNKTARCLHRLNRGFYLCDMAICSGIGQHHTKIVRGR